MDLVTEPHVVLRELPFSTVLLDTRSMSVFRLPPPAAAVVRRRLAGDVEPVSWPERRLLDDLSRAGLVAERGTAIDWVTAHLSEFHPGESPGMPGRAKRCGELAMVHAYVSAWVADGSLPAAGYGDVVGRWQEPAVEYCGSPDLAAAVRDDPGRGLQLLLPYLWLRAAGHRLAHAEDLLAGVVSRELPPGAVGLHHAAWKAGLLPDEPRWADVAPRWLDAWAAPGELRRSAYRVTHAALYVTDVGTHPPALAAAELERLVAAAHALLADAVPERSWDLTAELLLALRVLGADGTPEAESAGRALAARRLPDGATPAGPPRPGSAVPPQRFGPAERFRDRYHPTLVDVLLGAVRARTAPAGAGREGAR